MNRVAIFEKVSFKEFKEEFERWVVYPTKYDIKMLYDDIKLPERSTRGSMGYDFYCPKHIKIGFGEHKTIPTGIRVKFIEDGWGLVICPRSGSSFKYGVRLANTLGVIDSDYYYSDNEGQILVRMSNESVISNGEDLCFEKGKGFCQGIFLPYGITLDDSVDTVRNGGFGSTG